MVVVKHVKIGNTKEKREISITTYLENGKTVVCSTFIGFDRESEQRQTPITLSPKEAYMYGSFLLDIASGIKEENECGK